MSFRERSAWVMAALIGAAGIYYAHLVVAAWREIGAPPPPMLVIAFVILVVVGSVVAQVILAVTDPKNAEQPADERERPIIDRAGNWSGLVLGAGTVTSLLHYLAHGDGNLLFHTVMASLIVSSIAEYGFQIALMRRA